MIIEGKSKETINNKYDIMVISDVTYGNPNGDPDNDNMPRVNYRTNKGIITGVCTKHKIRRQLATPSELDKNPRKPVLIQTGTVINERLAKIYEDYNLVPTESNADNRALVKTAKQKMCETYIDVALFGGVLSTGDNVTLSKSKGTFKKQAGSIRGPIQVDPAMSVNDVFPIEVPMTRCCITKQADLDKSKQDDAGTCGSRYVVDYGIYKQWITVNANDAAKTGMTNDDFDLFIDSLIKQFDNDRAAGKGLQRMRYVIIFKHAFREGCAHNGVLSDRIKVEALCENPSKFEDFSVGINRKNLPDGIELIVHDLTPKLLDDDFEDIKSL
jgi:CRISPR-associated protein Csd2